MNRNRRLVISALAGLIAAAVAFLAISGAQEDAERLKSEVLKQYGGELTSVCVASREIEPGEKVDEGNTMMADWVDGLLPDGAVSSLAEVSGRTATSQIPAHAPLAEAYFDQRGGSMDVPRGMVAVSVASDPEHAVGGVLKRGERVEVYAQADAQADKVTDARVIDSSALSSGGGEMEWVTLAVRPSVVGELLAAASRGMLSLVIPGAQSGARPAEHKQELDAGEKRDAVDAESPPRGSARSEGASESPEG